MIPSRLNTACHMPARLPETHLAAVRPAAAAFRATPRNAAQHGVASRPRLRRILQMAAVASVLLLGSAASVAAAGADHPLVGRYEGSTLVGEHHSEYDEANIMVGPIAGTQRGPGAPGWKTVEGKQFLFYYALPEGRSSLEVLRNYESSLSGKGFNILFTCATSNGSCYIQKPDRQPDTAPYDLALAFDDSPELPRLDSDYIRNYFGQTGRYLLARLDRPEGAVYASITLAEGNHGPHAFVRVTETREMDANKIRFIGAEEMRSTLQDSGRISLYGIWFDTDRDVVKPDSAPTLGEIAKLLQGDPSLRVEVVGHTDGQGEAVHNQSLSDRRARAVVAALVAQHGIAADRLQSRGAGMSQPVASNDDDAGRARNRRVELVRL